MIAENLNNCKYICKGNCKHEFKTLIVRVFVKIIVSFYFHIPDCSYNNDMGSLQI